MSLHGQDLTSSITKQGAVKISDEARAICEQVASFIAQLGEPQHDPSIAQGCIDVLVRLIPTYTYLLLEDSSGLSQQLPQMLTFTLQEVDKLKNTF